MRGIISVLLLAIFCSNMPAKTNNEKPKKKSAKTHNNKSEENEIYLNFEDASLSNVVQYLAEKKKINLTYNSVTHKDLEAQKVTLSTRTPFSLEKAWDILLTLLATSNFTLINVDDVYRIVPNGEKKQQPLPSYIGIDPENLPDSDLTVRYIYLFKNAQSENIKPILDVLLDGGSVQYSDPLNACIITEKCISIKSAMKVVIELDRGGLRQSIQILKLKEADAEVVAKTFDEGILGVKEEKRNIRFIVPPKKGTFFSARTKLIPDPRNNTLIMLGTTDELQKVREFIGKFIDIPIDSSQSRLHIKELKYTNAEKIKPILDAVIKPPIKDKKSPLVGQVKYFEDMVISAEAAEDASGKKVGTMGSGNRLLIACNRDDWIRIEKFIDRLDKPQPQVAMEILFVDLSLEDSRKLGAQLRNKSAGMLGKHIDTQAQHLVAIPSSFTKDLRNNLVEHVVGNQITENASFMTLGKDSDVHAVLKSVLKTDNSSIISQPYLVASNHQKCRLLVSESRRVVGEVSGESTSAVVKREDVDAETAIEIIPGINSDGVITLKIDISINEFLIAGIEGGADKTNRTIKTLTTMLDGEVLVIGGLTKNKAADNAYKTPGLSKIPIIGNLFRSRNKTLNKADLYVFIRPTLIKPRFEGKPGDYTQLKLDYARLAIKRTEGFSSTKDPIQKWFFEGTPTKPTRTLEEPSDEVTQVNNFVTGKKQPRSVIVPIDPFYKTKTSRTIRRLKKKALGEQEERNRKKLT